MADRFLLDEVISELMDNKQSLVGPLMKLQYFASVTKNDELLNYVLSELKGYKSDELPEYRRAFATISIDLQFGHIQAVNKELPIHLMDKELQIRFSQMPLYESVSVLEKIAKGNSGSDEQQFITHPFPLALLYIFQKPAQKVYKSTHYTAQVTAARQIANPSVIETALIAIRSGLLTFCTEIMETFGDEIGIKAFNQLRQENNEKITTIMNTTINNHGDGNVTNTGEQAVINATINISKGNKQELTKKLEDFGIDAVDIGELHATIEEENPAGEPKKLGNKTIDWITKISGKALKGIGSVTKDVTSAVLVSLINQHLGLPQP